MLLITFWLFHFLKDLNYIVHLKVMSERVKEINALACDFLFFLFNVI